MFNTPEELFLISIVRHDNAERLKEELRELCKKGLDWHTLALYCYHPIFYLKTKDFYKEIGIPAEIFEKWEKAYLITIIKNSIALEKIKELAVEFKNNIEYIFLKGAAELVTIYKDDPGRRPMADIDVLVKPSDIDLAEEIIVKNMGYTYKPHPVLDRDTELRLEHSRTYLNKSRSSIDLHCALLSVWEGRLFRSEERLLKECFERKDRIILGNEEVFVPDPTTLLVISIMHGIEKTNFPSNLDVQWHMEDPSDIAIRNYQQNKYFLSQTLKIKGVVRRFAREIDWKRMLRNLSGLERDPKVRQMLAVCRACDIEQIPEDFYAIFRIPKKINRKFFKGLTRKLDAMVLGQYFSELIKGKIDLREFSVYLLVYLFGVNFLFKVRNTYRKLFRHA